METQNQTTPVAKKKRQARKAATVSIVQNVTTAITVGRDNYLLKGTEDGRGVRLENGAGGIFIPYGEGGKAILEQLTAQIGTSVTRKRRRTKAEILAAKESE